MKKILVWLSGGVDSAVAAYLLKEQWYEVVAGFMKNYVDEENPNCSTYKDANEAIKVAKFLWIDILSFDLRQEYEDKIIKYIYDWYQKWITPNPDILCNTLIKFDVFLHKAIEAWFDWIATGHYARIEKQPLTPISSGSSPNREQNFSPVRGSGEAEGVATQDSSASTSEWHTNHYYKLLRWVDYNKDQTYFLSWLNQYQLSKSLFPIGWMTKPEVRELAKKAWLPNAERPDSQWLCFVWKVPMRTFLKKRLPIKKWDIVLMDGTKVWEHDWAYFFTIWQSRGLDINKKAFVVKIDVEKNLVYVSYDKYEPELITRHIEVKDWHWIWHEYDLPLECSTKIRYRQEPNPSTMESKDWKIFFSYNQDQRWVAKWQSVVAYLWDECIGWGIIE